MAKVQVSLLRRVLCIVNIFSSFMLLFVKGYTGFNQTIPGTTSLDLPDAVSFVGFYFRYQFPSWYRSKSLSLQVTEAGTDALPTWLFLNRSSVSLEGVPLATDEGYTYLQIFLIDSMQGASLSYEKGNDVFAINVQFPGLVTLKAAFLKNSGNIFAKNSRTQQDEYGIHYCQSYETRFFVSLMLAFSLQKSTGEHRIHIVKHFSDFLSKEPHEIVLSLGSNDVIRRLRGVVVLESKLEVSDNYSLPMPGNAQLSWYIACDTFTRSDDLSRVLSHNIKSGLLQNVIGHAVLGWSLLAKHSKDKTVSIEKRVRRQANGFQTPMPTPTLSTIAPSLLSSSILQTSDITPVSTSFYVPSTSSIASSLNPTPTIRPTATTVTDRSSTSSIMQTPSVTLVTEASTTFSFTSSTTTPVMPSSVFITPTSSVYTIISSVFPSLQTDSSLAISSQMMFTSIQSSVSSTAVTSSTEISQTSTILPETTSDITPASTMTFSTSHRLFETTSAIVPTSATTSPTLSTILETTFPFTPTSKVTSPALGTIPETTFLYTPTSAITSSTLDTILETTLSMMTTLPLMSSRLLETTPVVMTTSKATSLIPTSTLETTSAISSTSPFVQSTSSRLLETTPIVPTTMIISSASNTPLETSAIISTGTTSTLIQTTSTPRTSLETTVAISTSLPSSSLVSSRIFATTSVTLPTLTDTFSLPVTFTDSISTLTFSSQNILPSTSMQSHLFTTTLPPPVTSVRPPLSTSILKSSITSVMTSPLIATTTVIHSSLSSDTVRLTPTAEKTTSFTASGIIPSTFSASASKTSITLQPSQTIQSSFMTTFTPRLSIDSTASVPSSLPSFSFPSSYTPTSVAETLSTFFPSTQSSFVLSTISPIIRSTTPEQVSTSLISTPFSQMDFTSMITPSTSQGSITSIIPSLSSKVTSILMTEFYSSPVIQPSSLLSSFSQPSVISDFLSSSTATPFVSSTTRDSMSLTSFQASSDMPDFRSVFNTPLTPTTSMSIDITQQTSSPFMLSPSTSLISEFTISSNVILVSSFSTSDMLMTSSFPMSSSKIIRSITRVTLQPSPSLSRTSRMTFMSTVPSVSTAISSPGISTPVTVSSEMPFTQSTPSLSIFKPSTPVSGISSVISSRNPVSHSTQFSMTSESLFMTSFKPTALTSFVPSMTTIKVSSTRSSEVIVPSQTLQVSDTLPPSLTFSFAIGQTVSVSKSSAISVKPTLSVTPSYSTSRSIQSTLSSINSTFMLSRTTVSPMSSSVSDDSPTMSLSVITSEKIFSTTELVSFTIIPSLSSDKLSSSPSLSLERTISASKSSRLLSTEMRTIPFSMESVSSSSKTRSIQLSSTIPSTHVLPTLMSHMSPTFMTKSPSSSSVQQSSSSEFLSSDQSSILARSSASMTSSSSVVETSISRLQSSSHVTPKPPFTTSSLETSRIKTSSTLLPTPSSMSVDPSSILVTASQLPSLTSRVIPSVTSVISPSSTLNVSPSSVTSSLQMKTSLSTIEMITSQTVTRTSTITKFTSTVRTPPLATTPGITSSPLTTGLTVSASRTTLKSLLPSLSSTGIIAGTTSLSSEFLPSPTPSSRSHDMVSSSPVIGTTQSTTTEEPTTDVVLTTVPRDVRPNLLNPVDLITYTSGTVFEYPVPPDTFFDKEDGSTPHLSLTLLGDDYQLVGPSSWIQLDEDNQALFGFIISDSSVTEEHQFFLAATDSNRGVAYDSFKVRVYPNGIDYSHRYKIILNSNFVQFTADSRNLYNFCRNLVKYHKDSLSSLNIQAVSNGSVVITYSNNTMPVSFCDLQSIEAVLRKMIFANGSLVPEFQSEIGKLFSVSDVLVEYLGKCAGMFTTDAPVIPKGPQIGDSTLFISVLIGLCLIFILFLIVCLICIYCTKKRPGEEYLLAEEKIVYTKNRKPIILKNDRDDRKPPRRTYPAVLPDDISPFKPERNVTPPIKSIPPPSYKPSSAQDNYLELDDFDHFPPNNPPPGYSPSPLPGPPTRRDPPAYQQPPPYFPSQKNGGDGKFQTTHF